MCEEESEDTEAVEKLKQINDSIQRTIERYKLVKNGDFEGAARIPKGTLGTTTGVGKNANNELSLIDFDPEESAPSNGQEQAATNSLEDDLLGLSFADRSTPGPVNLGFGMYSLKDVCVVMLTVCRCPHCSALQRSIGACSGSCQRLPEKLRHSLISFRISANFSIIYTGTSCTASIKANFSSPTCRSIRFFDFRKLKISISNDLQSETFIILGSRRPNGRRLTIKNCWWNSHPPSRR